MWLFWLGLGLGVLVGVSGAVTLALCLSAGRADRLMARVHAEEGK